jgi:PAS domain S-box-containing protein
VEQILNISDITDYAPIGLLVLSLEGKIVEFNQKIATILNQHSSSLIGKSLESLLSIETQSTFNRFLDKIIKQSTEEACEVIIQPNEGTVKHIQIKGQYQEAKGLYFIALIDITNDKNTAYLLNKSNERFINLADNLLGYLAFIDANTLRFEYVNIQFSNLMGFPRDNIIGSHIKDIIGEINYNATLNHIEKVRSGEYVTYEKLFDINSEKRWFKVDYYPLYNKSGSIEYIATLSTDITRLKLSEELLKETTRTLELALASAKAGAWEWDILVSSSVWSTNLIEIFRLFPGKIAVDSQSWSAVLHPDDIALGDNKIKQALNDNTKFDYDYRIILPTGEIKWLNSIGEGIYDEEGNLFKMVGICMDITERKNAEKELDERMEELSRLNTQLEKYAYANEELKQFAFISSHQLQEPIRTVSNFAQVIEEEYSELLEKNGLTFLHIIKDAAKRMTFLVDSLLEFSQLDRSSKLNYVDLNQVLANVINGLNEKIMKSEAIIKFSEMPKLYVYETKIYQLFLNLISNAIKFQKKGNQPIIKVDAKKIDNFWQFSISDNGIGILPAHYEKVFEIFQRLHATEDEYEGKGIGLAHCKKIVHIHEGEIWVESKIDEGSTFYFTIPG